MAEADTGWSPVQRAGGVLAVAAFATAVVVACLAARDRALGDPAWLDYPTWLGPRAWVVGAALLVGTLALRRVTDWVGVRTAVWMFLSFAVPALMATALTTAVVEDVREWRRTDRSVTVTLTGCHKSGTTTGIVGDNTVSTTDVFSCTYSWPAGGLDREQVRSTEESHPDGYRIRMWTDPSTGELSGHPVLGPLGRIFLSALFGLTALFSGYSLVLQLHKTRLFRRAARDAPAAA